MLKELKPEMPARSTQNDCDREIALVIHFAGSRPIKNYYLGDLDAIQRAAETIVRQGGKGMIF
jgi:hypothetical protein